jgi:hypothetical protein
MNCSTLRLVQCLDYGQIELSNNLAENTIRPVAIRRRYEKSRIRQSLTCTQPGFLRRVLDVADQGTLPVFA